MTRKLGKIQREVLNSLVRWGGYPNGWYWQSRSLTERVLASLTNRGLATVTVDAFGMEHWTPTPEGRATHTNSD